MGMVAVVLVVNNKVLSAEWSVKDVWLSDVTPGIEVVPALHRVITQRGGTAHGDGEASEWEKILDI
jgi:hypothetical protein